MTERELRKTFQDWIFRGSAYRMALSVIGYDRNTVAPKGGAEYREKRTAFLSGELFAGLTDPAIEPVLRGMAELEGDREADLESCDSVCGAVGRLPLAEFSSDELRRMAALCLREYDEAKAVPKEAFVFWQTTLSRAFRCWREAKEQNDYAILAPDLQRVIDGACGIAMLRLGADPDDPLGYYEEMLRKNEPGMTLEKYDAFFSLIRERIVPLVRHVSAEPQADDSFLHGHFDIERQRAFSKILLRHLGFTPDWGLQGETEHPVTIWIASDDVRTTTHFREEDLTAAIFSTIHECGHAWYAHNVDPRYEGTALLGSISAAMHESQSRLLENHIGRSEAFWEPLYPELRKLFPEALGEVSLKRFVAAINRAKPTLIRTQADELTYPVHILIRYELEKELFSRRLSAEDLPAAWREKYQEYLGLTPTDDREGVLQDMHWAGGYHAYFPAYALGSAIAAQIMHTMEEAIDVDGLLRAGRVPELMRWLRENVHRYGAFYYTEEILRHATGEAFDPKYYIQYLEEKYGR